MGFSIWLKSTPHWETTTWPPNSPRSKVLPSSKATGAGVSCPRTLRNVIIGSFIIRIVSDKKKHAIKVWKRVYPGKKTECLRFYQSYWPNHWTRILSRLQQKHRLYQLVFVSLRGPQWMQRLKTCTAFYGRWWFRSDIGHAWFHGEMWVE